MLTKYGDCMRTNRGRIIRCHSNTNQCLLKQSLRGGYRHCSWDEWAVESNSLHGSVEFIARL
eukprot:4630337-Amphidinium_carterae.1